VICIDDTASRPPAAPASTGPPAAPASAKPPAAPASAKPPAAPASAKPPAALAGETVASDGEAEGPAKTSAKLPRPPPPESAPRMALLARGTHVTPAQNAASCMQPQIMKKPAGILKRPAAVGKKPAAALPEEKVEEEIEEVEEEKAEKGEEELPEGREANTEEDTPVVKRRCRAAAGWASRHKDILNELPEGLRPKNDEHGELSWTVKSSSGAVIEVLICSATAAFMVKTVGKKQW